MVPRVENLMAEKVVTYTSQDLSDLDALMHELSLPLLI